MEEQFTEENPFPKINNFTLCLFKVLVYTPSGADFSVKTTLHLHLKTVFLGYFF